jgi:hypothetical protein
MHGQTVASDTTKIYKFYPKDIPTIAFDSARISPNGRYALVLKGDNLNGCWVNYWSLYEKGKDKPVEHIVISDGFAHLLDYENGQIKDGLTITQNGETYSWDLSRKCSVKDLIKQYSLTVKPNNATKKLKVVFDTLSSIPVNIPAEFSQETVNRTETRMAQRVEVKFYYRDNCIFTSQINFLPDPEPIMESGGDFNIYIETIKKQIEAQPVGSDYGMLFLESGTDYFLSFNVESWFFSGRQFESHEEGKHVFKYISSSPGSSPGAKFELLQSFKL